MHGGYAMNTNPSEEEERKRRMRELRDDDPVNYYIGEGLRYSLFALIAISFLTVILGTCGVIGNGG